MRGLLALFVVVAATWHAWRWYLNRIMVAPEEGAALVMSVGFVLAMAWRERAIDRMSWCEPLLEASSQNDAHASTPPNLRRRPEGPWNPGLLVSALLVLYAVSFAAGMPPIGRAALAVCAAVACVYGALLKQRPPLALFALIALSLPVLPSLQMTFGYGLRVVSAAMTAGMLRAQGLAVERQGTFLVWRGEMVQFDAPCSGVNMVWAGLLIALMGSIALRLSFWRSALAVLAGALLAVMGNVLRASSLFYVETGLVAGMPPFAHEAIGVVAFALGAAGLAWVLRALEPGEVSS